jgi:DNA-binding SARP family transcriptional activator
MSAAEVRVLGPVEVLGVDGLAVPLPAKQLRLLAALVVAGGHAVGADELVEAVWDGAQPASARSLVQVYVSQLRKTLPSEIPVATRGGGYALELAESRLDAARFERLLDECGQARRDANPALAASLAEQALTLWRGRAYGELA